MKHDVDIQNAIDKAVRFLASQQQPDGGFVSFSSTQSSPLRQDIVYRTTFTPALMLAALSQLPSNEAVAVRNRLVQFLLQQKGEQWSFNYWARESQEARDTPYPDDLDDTFCALSALWLHDASLIDEAALAGMVKVLLATEAEVGGPYRTWLVPPDSPAEWRDVDVAVNANIAYFLSLASNPLPKLTALLEQTIRQGRYHSRYYPNAMPVVYYIARAYNGPLSYTLAQYLWGRRKSDGSWGTPLRTALALTSLLRLGQKGNARAVRYLLTHQGADGAWDAEAFCLDPARDGIKYYSGTPALTSAFVLEALHLYQQLRTPHARQPASPSRKPPHMPIIQEAKAAMQNLDNIARRPALAMLQRTASGKNAQEITLLAQFFYSSLRAPGTVPDKIFTELSLANLYGWIAYTIYDDFLDDEGDPKLLSVANIMMRRSLDAFERAVPASQTFQALVQTTFDTIDTANTWEVTNCRFAVKEDLITIGTLPRYGQLSRLAERSLGHALPPLGILAALDIPLNSEQAKELLGAFRHYLIARQLNDDAHDWLADLQAGRITYVLAAVLQELDVPPGPQKLSELTPKVEHQFWHFTLEKICQRILRHTRLSRQALAKSELLKQGNAFEKLLDVIDDSVADTRATTTQAKRFLRAYRETT